MRIGELADATGISTSRIRFYEAVGLLLPADRTSTGYRVYDDDAVQALRIVEQAQLAGFTLAEIKALLPAHLPGSWDRDAVLSALRTKLSAVEDMQRTLAASGDCLRAVIADIATKPTDADCEQNAREIMAGLGILAPAAG